jgi:hypothetical protein
VDPAATDDLVVAPGVERMAMRGREMDGWVHVIAEAVEVDDDLEPWVRRGLAYARSLPPKT